MRLCLHHKIASNSGSNLAHKCSRFLTKNRLTAMMNNTALLWSWKMALDSAQKKRKAQSRLINPGAHCIFSFDNTTDLIMLSCHLAELEVILKNACYL